MNDNSKQIEAVKARIAETKKEISTLENEPKTKEFEKLDEFRQDSRMRHIRMRTHSLNQGIKQAELEISALQVSDEVIDEIVEHITR